MKLKIINNRHGPDSKAWYTLKPLMRYHDPKGIPTMWGLAMHNYQHAQQLSNQKQPWIFCDMPYWGRWNPLKQAVDPGAEYYWRICYSDIHVTGIVPNLPQHRIQHINIKPWKKTQGDYILVAPSSNTVNAFIGESTWEQKTVAWLKTKTDMPIKVRHKPRKGGRSGPAYADVPLADDLKNADCVVTSCSMVSIDAVIEGIPVYCNAKCPAMPVAQTIDKFGQPVFSEQRLDWLTTLSWHQYTQQEIEEGLFESMFGEMYALR